MLKRKIDLFFGICTILFLISVQPVSAAELTWHSSVKEDGSWKWKVTNFSGELTTYFPALTDIEEGSIIEVNATGNPPTVGDWTTLVGSNSVAWADIYVNNTKPSGSENVIYFFIAPLDIGNTSNGWEAWSNTIFGITAFLSAFGGGGTPDYTNKTSDNSITYEISASGGSGSNQWSIAHEITYKNDTGFLQTYIYSYSNTTLSSSVTITKEAGGILGDIPGFELVPLVLSLAVLALLPFLRRKR